MTTTIDSVTPGIALSAAEATRLKGKIAALVEGMMPAFNAGPLVITGFKDDRNQARTINVQVTSIIGQTIHVVVNNMV
jgi:hypothetical protein